MEIALYCRSGARSGGSRSGNGAGSGGYRIRLERGAAFSPAPLRSHALTGINVAKFELGQPIYSGLTTLRHAVTLTFNPLTLSACGVSAVT